ncbi:MAG: peroxide stress protein YaaA, partial [Tissierellia bacterium]|nr:peroxide stress protein YaaA [Tissierellia bacterium]
MIIICSPTKTIETAHREKGREILFPEKTKQILQWIREMSRGELQKMWKCSDKVLDKSVKFFDKMDLDKKGAMALDSFTGLFFKNIDAQNLPDQGREYLQNHLLILSAFYGILRPFDGIQPYRLDYNDRKSLYQFWKEDLENEFSKRKGPIINLASKEYGEDLLSQLTLDHEIIHINFYEEIVNKKGQKEIKQKATPSKEMRGRFIREMALQKIDHAESLKKFQINGYSFSEKESQGHRWVFLKEEK